MGLQEYRAPVLKGRSEMIYEGEFYCFYFPIGSMVIKRLSGL